jgi:hypothetical protein
VQLLMDLLESISEQELLLSGDTKVGPNSNRVCLRIASI